MPTPSRISLASLLLALALAPLAVSATDPEKLDPDLARLQGRWTTKVGPNKRLPMTFVLEGDKAIVTFSTPNNGDVSIRGRIKVDSTKSPKELDWTAFTGPGGNTAPDNLALYELDGDTLRVCNGGPGNERPQKFEEAGDEPPHILVFRRQAETDRDEK